MKIKFTGALAEQFGGGTYDLAVRSVGEAFKALIVMVDGLEAVVRENLFTVWANGEAITENQLGTIQRDGSVIEIELAVGGAGSNGGGIFAVIAGIVIIAFTWWTGGGAVTGATMIGYGLGAGIALMGVGQLLMMPKMPKVTGDDDGNKASYGFGGAVTTISQGNVIPVAYGECFQGGFVLTWQMVSELTDHR